MREKKRYLLIAIEGPAVDEDSAKHLVYEAVFQFLGEAGAAEAGVRFKEFDAEKNRAVIRCANAAVEKVVAALAAKRYWQGKDVALRVKRISGMIGKLL